MIKAATADMSQDMIEFAKVMMFADGIAGSDEALEMGIGAKAEAKGFCMIVLKSYVDASTDRVAERLVAVLPERAEVRVRS
jgi:hypothetical protein